MQCDQLPYEKGEFGHKCIHKENAGELEGRNQGAASTSQAALKMAYTPWGLVEVLGQVVLADLKRNQPHLLLDFQLLASRIMRQ